MSVLRIASLTLLLAGSQGDSQLRGSKEESVPTRENTEWGNQTLALFASGAPNSTGLNATAANASDAVLAATLSADAGGCYASIGALKGCGGRCFGRPAGDSRVDCISKCLHQSINSWRCTTCYGRRSDCTMSRCLRPCAASATGSACEGCVHSKCGGGCR